MSVRPASVFCANWGGYTGYDWSSEVPLNVNWAVCSPSARLLTAICPMKLEVSDSPAPESRLYCVPATQMDTGSTTLTLPSGPADTDAAIAPPGSPGACIHRPILFCQSDQIGRA